TMYLLAYPMAVTIMTVQPITMTVLPITVSHIKVSPPSIIWLGSPLIFANIISLSFSRSSPSIFTRSFCRQYHAEIFHIYFYAAQSCEIYIFCVRVQSGRPTTVFLPRPRPRSNTRERPEAAWLRQREFSIRLNDLAGRMSRFDSLTESPSA